MNIPVCNKCGEAKVFLRQKGNAVGLYCSGCGRWHKWVGKKDIVWYKHNGFRIFSEDYIPQLLKSNNINQRKDYGVEENIVTDNDGVIISDNNVRLENTDCPICSTGVLECISKPEVAASIFNDVLTIYNSEKTQLLGAYKIRYCPGCGKKLT